MNRFVALFLCVAIASQYGCSKEDEYLSRLETIEKSIKSLRSKMDSDSWLSTESRNSIRRQLEDIRTILRGNLSVTESQITDAKNEINATIRESLDNILNLRLGNKSSASYDIFGRPTQSSFYQNAESQLPRLHRKLLEEIRKMMEERESQEVTMPQIRRCIESVIPYCVICAHSTHLSFNTCSGYSRNGYSCTVESEVCACGHPLIAHRR